MRGRAPGLLPLELALLQVAIRFEAEGTPMFHGFLAAQFLKEAGFHARLAATGTIYTTLDRLRRSGFLESEWEDVAISEEARRPRRRLYRITPSGHAAAAAARHVTAVRPGFAGADG